MCVETCCHLGVLVLPCPMVTVSGQIEQPRAEEGITTKGSASSEMRVC